MRRYLYWTLAVLLALLAIALGAIANINNQLGEWLSSL